MQIEKLWNEVKGLRFQLRFSENEIKLHVSASMIEMITCRIEETKRKLAEKEIQLFDALGGKPYCLPNSHMLVYATSEEYVELNISLEQVQH